MADTPSPASAPAGTPADRLSQLRIARGTAGVRRRRRRWPWIVAGLLVLGGGFALFGPHRTEVQVGTVQSAHGAQQYVQLSASGYVVAQRRAAVSSKATGRLIELRVREGSVVKAGDLLARVDPADVQATLQASQAGAAQAQAAVKQAEAAQEQARVQQANADEDLQRTQGLVAQGFVSPQALDAARTRAASARAAAAAAGAAVQTARAAVRQAEAQVQVQQVGRDSTEIRAPFDGVVLVKNANVGDLITPFSNASGTSGAVVTMADMGTLEVEADVSESNVGKLHADQPVEITLDALPGERMRGSVSRIVPTVDRAKATVMTKVRFEKLDARILPEMSAKVSFLSQRPGEDDFEPLLAVPPAAIVERDGHAVVLRVADGDVLETVPVTRGRTLGDAVEVKGSPLKAGERIVLSPAATLHGGSKVSAAGGK
jgi:HlyD family secretion protein